MSYDPAKEVSGFLMEHPAAAEMARTLGARYGDDMEMTLVHPSRSLEGTGLEVNDLICRAPGFLAVIKPDGEVLEMPS